MFNRYVRKHDCDSSKTEQVGVVTIGAFGRAVAGYLRQFRPRVRELNVSSPAFPPADAVEEILGESAALVIVASHPVAAICERFAGIAHERQCPFVPAIIDECVLRLGPVEVPAVGGCWPCWVARRAQHDGHHRETAALQEFYDHHPGSGPQGYLEPFAWITAAQIAALLGSRQQLEQWAGKIWQLDLFSREVTTGELVGVDGCSRCGLNRQMDIRTYAEMQESLAHLWSENSLEKKNGMEATASSQCGELR